MRRVVLIRYQQGGDRRVGSGLRIGGNRVLTAGHVANGTGHSVRTMSKEYPAQVLLRSEDPMVDLAIVEVPELGEVPGLGCARVNREEARTITGCTAVGYPRHTTGKNQVRRIAQVEGTVSTAQGLPATTVQEVAEYLVLKATGPTPRDLPPVSGEVLEDTPWSGMSGAVLFTGDDQILGVVRHHNPPEGTGALAVTPITAIDSLPEPVRTEFWAALGVADAARLPVLPHRSERVLLRERFGRLLQDRDYAVFAGRGDVVHAVEQFLDGPGGILAVTAPAGFGKTALLASLVRGDPDRYAYHFLTHRYDPQWLDEAFFLQSILEQLDPAISAELPTLDLPRLKARFQAQLAARTGALASARVLLLDGLDEVPGWSPADYLAVILPEGTHVIVSIRDVGQDWASQYRLPTDQLTVLPLDGFNRDAITAVFTATGPHAAELIHQPGAADLIATKAAYETPDAAAPGTATVSADPLYVRFLAQDANTPDTHLEDLQNLPTGLTGYLDRWRAEIRKVVADRPVGDLFAVLALAHGPLNATDLRALAPAAFEDPAGWADDYFDTDVLPAIRRLLTGNDQAGYTLAHPRLTSYLRTRLTASTRDTARQALLDYCAHWPEHHSVYALTHYPTHLAEERPESFASLVTDLDYLEAAIRALGINGVTQGLRAALAASEQLTSSDHTTVDRVIRLASRQAHHMRPPYPIDIPGYVALQLRLQDQSTTERLFHEPNDRPSKPGLSVLWSSAATSPAEVFTLPGRYGFVTITPDGSLAILALGNIAQVWELGAVDPVTPVATFIQHTREITAIAITADGRRAVSTARDETIWVWEVRTGRSIRRLDPTGALRGDGGPDKALVLRPNSTHAVTISENDRAVRVWDTETGVLVHTLHGHTGPLRAIAVTADGALAVSTDLDGKALVWDLASGEPRFALSGHTDWTSGVATGTLASDGRRAVTIGEDSAVCVWDLEAGRLIERITDHAGRLWDVAVTSDGSRAITVGAIDVMLWNLDDCSQIAKMDGHDRDVFGVKLDASGDRAITYGIDTYACLWDAHSGDKLAVLYGHSDSIDSASLSPHGTRAVTTSSDGTARVWDGLVRGASVRTGHTARITSTAVSRDGARVITGSEDGSARVWDVASGAELRTLVNQTSDIWQFRRVTGVAISADGTRALTTGEQSVRLWDVDTGRRLFDRRTSWSPDAVALAPDGSRAITLDGQTAQVWALSNGKELCSFLSPEEPFVAVAIVQNGVEAVTAGADGIARRWNLSDGAELGELTGHSGPLTGIAVTNDGAKVVTSSADGTARIWRLADGQVLATLREHTAAVTGVSLSRHGKWGITSSEDCLAILWDIENARPLRTFSGHTASVLNSAFAADGRAITLGADKTVRVWDEATGQQEHLLAMAAAPSSFTTANVGGRSIIVVGELSGAVTTLVLE
jgi:WD40 repeat protein